MSEQFEKDKLCYDQHSESFRRRGESTRGFNSVSAFAEYSLKVSKVLYG